MGMRGRIFLSALICLLIHSMARAKGYQEVATQPLFNGEKILEYKLDNGLQVLLLPRHQAKVLSYQVWFRVGSVDEKLDPKLRKTGLAHLFEHMMFRGTEKYPDGKFDELTSRMGATGQNATTYYYRTNYFQSVPSSKLEELMELETDRMQNLIVNKDLFEKEKGAVVGELRRHLDSPIRIAYDELLALMHKRSPFRWTVIGTEKEITGFTLEEAQYFYRTFYAPNNAVLILVGDITPEKVLPMIVKYYGPMKSQKIPERKKIAEAPQSQPRLKTTTHRQATSEILLMGYVSPPIDSGELYPLLLLSSHLSNGREARLQRLLVDTGIAVSASCSPNNQPDVVEFLVQLAEGKKAETAKKIIEAEIAKIQKEGITQLEFERALNQELLDLYRGIGNNSRMARFLGEYLMLSGNYLKGFEIIEAYKKLTPEKLQQAAKKFFAPSQQNTIIIRPRKKGIS